jgi:hypothetical protein
MTFDCSLFKKRHQCNAWQAIFKTFSASDWMAALFYVGSKLFAKGLKSCPFLVPPSLSLSLSLFLSLVLWVFITKSQRAFSKPPAVPAASNKNDICFSETICHDWF